MFGGVLNTVSPLPTETAALERLGRGWHVLSVFEEARLHRLAYVDMLRSYLPNHGDETRLAFALGVHRVTVSYWLMPDGVRSPHTYARRIAEITRMKPEDRDTFIEHVRLSVVPRLRMEPVPHLVADISTRELAEAVDSEHAAMLAGRSFDVATKAIVIRDAGTTVLRVLNPSADPTLYVRVALAVWEALCFLDRPLQALYVAAAAGQLAGASHDQLASSAARRTMAQLYVDAIRAQGVSLHNAGADDRALDRYADAIRVAAALDLRSPAVLAWIGTDYLKALCGARSLRLDVLQIRAEQSVELIEDAERDGAILNLLTAEAHARAYIAYCSRHLRAGRLAAAENLVRRAVSALAETQTAGAIHRVMVLRTVGRLHRLAGDSVGWATLTQEARRIAEDAGLLGQVREIAEDLAPRGGRLAS